MDESKFYSSSDMVEGQFYSLLDVVEGKLFPSMAEKKFYC